jgi:hypothetical protein
MIPNYTPYIPENTGVLESLMVRDCCWCRNGVLAFIGFDCINLHKS